MSTTSQTMQSDNQTILKDDKGNVRVIIDGAINLETFARGLWGLKQRVEDIKKETAKDSSS